MLRYKKKWKNRQKNILMIGKLVKLENLKMILNTIYYTFKSSFNLTSLNRQHIFNKDFIYFSFAHRMDKFIYTINEFKH